MSSVRPLQNRITRTLLIVACIVYVIAAGCIGWLRLREERREVARIMQAQVEIVRSLVKAQILQHDSRIKKITKTTVGKEDQDVLSWVGSNLRHYDPFDIYYVLDRQGRIVLISDAYLEYMGFNPSNMEHIRKASKISKVYQSLFSRRSVIALQYQLNDHLRLVYERDLRNILPVMEHLGQGRILDQQSLFILTAEGAVVYHQDQSLVKSRRNLSFDLKERTAADDSGLFSYRWQGVKYYACTAKFSAPQGWVVYLQIPARLFIATFLRGISIQLVGLLLILLTVIFYLQVALHRFFSRPVSDIVGSLSRYRPGQESPPLSSARKSGVLEFSLIREAINRMAGDVTRSNQLLRDSEEHIRLLLNSMAEAIYGLDTDGKCTFCNAVFLQLMGYEREEDLLGKDMHGLIHHTTVDGGSYPTSQCSIMQSLRHGQEVYSESDFFWRSDGTCFPVQYWSHPIRVNGEFTGVVVTFLDITERKQADAERNTAVERFRTLVDSLDAIVYVADMETYEILFVNKLGERVCPDSVGKICWQTLQSGQSGPCDFCTNKKLLDQDGNPTGVHTWEFQNTIDKRWYECRDQAIRWTDGRMVRMEIATDITLRKEAEAAREKLEAQISQSQKMESIGTLAGGIAHDFNNILSAILGFSELARRDKDNQEDLLKDLDEVVGSANRAKDLVKQILTFSRRTEQQKQLLQVSLVIKEALKLLRSSIPTTIEMQENITSQSTALADPTQIHQVTMNLCSNAYHAMRETGGVLQVTLEDITTVAGDAALPVDLTPGRYIHLAVTDTGCGMDAPTMENIFEPYFTTKAAGEGTGLGLAVVHGIVESHNGHITVNSAAGQGTTFDIYLPLVEKEADDFTLDTRERPIVGGTERLILVDDEEKIATMATKLLSRYGYQVVSFHNAQQALQEFKKAPDSFDMVITDMTMPYMTGTDLAQRLLEIRPSLPVILCTGHSDIVNREKALAMGITEYCEKPLSIEKMLRKVRATLDRVKIMGTRILFVDDDQCNITLGKTILEMVGCTVIGMTDATEALELFRKDPTAVDVVFTDQVMPGIDGFELARQLLLIRQDLPICMLTGNAGEADREEAASIGIKEFLSKPLDLENMLKVISASVSK